MPRYLCRISVCHVDVRLSQAVGSSWDRSIYFSRVSMGLTDKRKTAKNLVDSRKNCKILTVSRKQSENS